MSYIADYYIASETNPRLSHEFGAGAMLPGIAYRAGVELDHANLDGDLAAGVRFHDTTDHIYLGDETFQELKTKVGASLANLGVAHAAQVGTELIVDGYILDNISDFVEVYRRGMGWLTQNYQVVGRVGADPSKLTAHLEDLAFRGVPAFLKYPAGVALELGRQFEIDTNWLLKPLTEIVACQQAEVHKSAGELLSRVIGGIRRG